MKLNSKSLVSWVAAVFIAYAIYKAPAKIGDVTSDIITFGGHALKSISVFFDSLLT